ncbi:hypothetical protein EK904_004046, partial [Melospiza melodia maxima]
IKEAKQLKGQDKQVSKAEGFWCPFQWRGCSCLVLWAKKRRNKPEKPHILLQDQIHLLDQNYFSQHNHENSGAFLQLQNALFIMAYMIVPGERMLCMQVAQHVFFDNGRNFCLPQMKKRSPLNMFTALLTLTSPAWKPKPTSGS